MCRRVAVMVDGDNVSAAYAKEILKMARTHGRPDVVRVYGNATCNSDWHTAAEYQMIHAGTGKNAADLILAIDAVEIAQSGTFEAFVIASSDSDFRHLAHHLRNRGVTVIGAGEAKTLDTFRAVCSIFKQLGPDQVTAPKCAIPSGKKPVPKLDANIQQVIAASNSGGQGIEISLLSQHMKQKFDTKISTHPEKTWRAYLTKRPDLYDVDPRGPKAKVRYKRDGFFHAT